jgi:hypothetical protein
VNFYVRISIISKEIIVIRHGVLKIMAFYFDITQLQKKALTFQRTHVLSNSSTSSLKMEATGCSEMLIPIYQTTPHHIPEDGIPNT